MQSETVVLLTICGGWWTSVEKTAVCKKTEDQRRMDSVKVVGGQDIKDNFSSFVS